MSDCFTGLGHYPIICSHHQDDNICPLGAAGAHGGKRCMPWSIQERDQFTVMFNLVSANMLGDPTGFTSCHFGMPDGIQQRGLAMINMPQNGNHRGT